MKFCSIVIVSVLLCVVAVHSLPGVPYGVPYSKPSLSVADFRAKLKCIDDVFDKLSGEFSELKTYHSLFKTEAIEINSKLDECDKIENPEKCVTDALNIFTLFLENTGHKLIEENKEATATLGIAIMFQCD